MATLGAAPPSPVSTTWIHRGGWEVSPVCLANTGRSFTLSGLLPASAPRRVDMNVVYESYLTLNVTV